MLALLDSIKKIIEKFIIAQTQMSSSISAGSVEIPVETTRRFQLKDEVAIYDSDVLAATGEGEIRTINCIDGNANTITVDEVLVDGYSASTGYVQKMIGERFVQSVYIGDPGKASHYPAISVNASNKDNSWLTLESTNEVFNVDITVFVDASDYEKSYRLMHVYAERIERALFRSLYPLVEPFDVAFLANAVAANDNVIRITDQNDLYPGQLGMIWLESVNFLRFNKVKSILQPGVFELFNPVSKPFNVGDKVIRPRRHMYDAFPRGIQYGTINQESGVFKAAKISYMATEEKKRFFPFIDPLDF